MVDEIEQNSGTSDGAGAGDAGVLPSADATDSTSPATADLGSSTADVSRPDGTGVADSDEFADLYEKEEDPAAPEVKQLEAVLDTSQPLYQTSEYVKTPEQALQAVQAASELWDVQTGKKDAGEFFDAMRTTNPERYRSAVAETLQAIKWAGDNGMLDLAKLGVSFGPPDPNAPKEDPQVAALRADLSKIQTAEQQRQAEQQRVQQEQVVAQTREKINGIFSEVSKGKWYEGDQEFHSEVLQQMDRNGVDAKLAQTNLAKWREGYEKAAKQRHNAALKTQQLRGKLIIAHQARLRQALSATPGQKGGPVSGKKSGEVLRSAFPEGPDGLRQWQDAQMTAGGWN